MNGIYGSLFANQWREVDPDVVRQTWKEECGFGLTYRPKMDYALKNMNPDRPPSALAFAKLLIDGPQIPVKPLPVITRQPTIHEQIATQEAKAIALEKLRKLSEEMRMKK